MPSLIRCHIHPGQALTCPACEQASRGRAGGMARSDAKLEAARRNLDLARAVKAGPRCSWATADECAAAGEATDCPVHRGAH